MCVFQRHHFQTQRCRIIMFCVLCENNLMNEKIYFFQDNAYCQRCSPWNDSSQKSPCSECSESVSSVDDSLSKDIVNFDILLSIFEYISII